MNLNQITLPVIDMAEAAAFYRRMGHLQIVDTPHYARFEAASGTATFSLSLETEPFSNGATIYFEVEALDALVDDLLAKGFKFDQLPQDMPYLWREAILHDPSGNKIKLYWAGEARLNPPWRVEQRDYLPTNSHKHCSLITLHPPFTKDKIPHHIAAASAVDNLTILVNEESAWNNPNDSLPMGLPSSSGRMRRS